MMQSSIPKLLRLKSIIAPDGPIPMSRSSFLAAVADGRVPKPVKLGRISAWRASDVQTLVDDGLPPAPLTPKRGAL